MAYIPCTLLPLPSTLHRNYFLFLTGLAYFLTSKNSGFRKNSLINYAVLACFYPFLRFYLTKQKSVLNTWPKPNELSDLLASYNDSLLILTIIIPLLLFIIKHKPNTDTKAYLIEETYNSKSIIITSVLWLSLPFIFWSLSHLSPLNLFVDRYFIPKD